MRRLFALLAIACLALFTLQCRTTNPERDADLAASENRPWFDKHGDAVECVVPPGGCKENSYDVKYVDLCVSKGFQAKSCGCTAACSGKVSQESKAARVEAKNPEELCSADDVKRVQTAVSGRSTGETKCLTSHVCGGDPTHCDAKTRASANTLRELARGKCQKEVFDGLCDGTPKDTLTCTEAQIDTIAALYERLFFQADLKLKRCVRAKICANAGVRDACDGVNANLYGAAESALATSGCSYWLSALCSIDGK